MSQSINPSEQKPEIEWAEIPAGTFIMGSPVDELNNVKGEFVSQTLTVGSFAGRPSATTIFLNITILILAFAWWMSRF